MYTFRCELEYEYEYEYKYQVHTHKDIWKSRVHTRDTHEYIHVILTSTNDPSAQLCYGSIRTSIFTSISMSISTQVYPDPEVRGSPTEGEVRGRVRKVKYVKREVCVRVLEYAALLPKVRVHQYISQIQLLRAEPSEPT